MRIFQVYGNGENPSRFWPSLKHCALNGSDFDMTLAEQVRDFIEVKDVAKMILDEALTDHHDARIRNVM